MVQGQPQPVICDFSRGRHPTTDEWIHVFASAPTAPKRIYIYKRRNGTSVQNPRDDSTWKMSQFTGVVNVF